MYATIQFYVTLWTWINRMRININSTMEHMMNWRWWRQIKGCINSVITSQEIRSHCSSCSSTLTSVAKLRRLPISYSTTEDTILISDLVNRKRHRSPAVFSVFASRTTQIRYWHVDGLWISISGRGVAVFDHWCQRHARLWALSQ